MSEWTKVADKLPRDGKAVDIKVAGEVIIRNVLFDNGRFWKKRIGPNAGHTWAATEWMYPEKGKKAAMENEVDVDSYLNGNGDNGKD